MCLLCLFSTTLPFSLSLPHILFLSLSPSLPLSLPLNPSASCRSVRLPVSVPIRFHLIHVTSINTQSSPDKSRPLSPPLCLSCVALHHSVFPNKLSSSQLLVTMYKITHRLHEQVNLSKYLRRWHFTAETGALHLQPKSLSYCTSHFRSQLCEFSPVFPADSCWCPSHPWRWRCLNYIFG